jgi:hypothetical protein
MSIHIDDTSGEVSGVAVGGTGNLAARVIKIEGNLIINNPTNQDLWALNNVKETPMNEIMRR